MGTAAIELGNLNAIGITGHHWQHLGPKTKLFQNLQTIKSLDCHRWEGTNKFWQLKARLVPELESEPIKIGFVLKDISGAKGQI